MRVLPVAALSVALACPAAAQDASDNIGWEFELEGLLTADVTLADVDGDGDMDVFAANGRHWAQPDFVYLNVGNGRMLEARPLGLSRSTSYTIRPIDLEGDGDIDAVVVRELMPVQLYRNDGEGNFAFSGLVAGTGGAARGAIHFDANGDGFDDVVVFRRRGHSLYLEADGEGGFHPAVEIEAEGDGATGGDYADFDGDGDMDVVVARRDGNASLVMDNDGMGHFRPRELAGSSGDHRKALAADFDGDGAADILLTDTDGNIALYRGRGDGGFAEPERSSVAGDAIMSLAASDLDLDGDMDVVLGTSGTNLVLENDGTGVFADTALPGTARDTYGVSVADMNGDGAPDAVFAHSGDPNEVFRFAPD